MSMIHNQLITLCKSVENERIYVDKHIYLYATNNRV